MKTLILAFFLPLIVTITATAQAVCPTDVILALARSGSACVQTQRNQACYGNGSVSASFYTEVLPFDAPGKIINASVLQRLRAEPIEEGISAASMLLQTSLSDVEERSVAVFLYGDAEVENKIAPTPEIVIESRGRLNVRATPEADGDIITQLNINNTLVANGIYEEGGWLRVHIPNSEDYGWVSTDVVTSQDDLSSLTEVGLNTIIQRPFEVMTFQTGEVSFCSDVLPSGILLQTPNIEQSVDLTVNGIALSIAASVFVQAPDENTLHFSVLDGWVKVAEDYIPAGTQAFVSNSGITGLEPFSSELIAALPVNNLPYRFTVAQPLAPDQIEAAIAALQPTPEVVQIRGTPQPTQTFCRRYVRLRTMMWAGPGDFYEAITELPSQTRVFPVYQYNGDNETWWQLDNNNWIDVSRTYEEGECPSVPVIAEPPRQTYNTLSMETCESLNGPLRVGQHVTIQFIPPAFESYAAAVAAPRIDPGTIKIDEEEYWVYASEPVRLGMSDMRYVRTFSTSWIAEGGAHRIASARLHYDLTCNITVPFG